MLVLSREAGSSIYAKSPGEACVMTVLRVSKQSISLLINLTKASRPGDLDSQEIELAIGGKRLIGQNVEVTLLDVRETNARSRARLGFMTSQKSLIHRMEVWQALHRPEDDSDGESTGSPVPRPSIPPPPSLNVKLDEPWLDQENDD